MKGIDFLEGINELDDDLLAAAAKEPVRKPLAYVNWLAVAACICLLAGVSFFVASSSMITSGNHGMLVGFTLNSSTYETPSLNSYVKYGFVSEVSVAKNTDVAMPQITKKDLGREMGKITIDFDGMHRACKVFHHADFPEDDSICIVKLPNNKYQLFIRQEN